MKTFALSLALLLGTSAFANDHEGGHHCKDKRDVRLAARKALDGCAKSWWNSSNPKMAEPSDDCAAKLGAYIEAAKGLRACRSEKGK